MVAVFDEKESHVKESLVTSHKSLCIRDWVKYQTKFQRHSEIIKIQSVLHFEPFTLSIGLLQWNLCYANILNHQEEFHYGQDATVKIKGTSLKYQGPLLS